jgi:hypothetical protein
MTDFFSSAGVTAEVEKFRTRRLVARSWQIEDLPLAMELWGDPAVTALIDARGKLTEAEVQDKLYAEIEREKSCGFSIGRCSITVMAISSAPAGSGPGSTHPAGRISKWDFIS